MKFDLKRAVKMNLRIITKNHAADPEIGFLTKLISKPYGRATAMPTAWKLILRFDSFDAKLFTQKTGSESFLTNYFSKTS